jgi:hypothetical protein
MLKPEAVPVLVLDAESLTVVPLVALRCQTPA